MDLDAIIDREEQRRFYAALDRAEGRLPVGTVLPNGAIVLAHEPGRGGDAGVVLARSDAGVRTFQPYVTWRIADDDLHTYWGHYYTTFDKAAADYRARVEKLRD